jgi:hypothetical protein
MKGYSFVPSPAANLVGVAKKLMKKNGLLGRFFDVLHAWFFNN